MKIKKIKPFIVLCICALLTTVVLVGLTGCNNNKYRPVSFTAEDGYTVSLHTSESFFLIKKADGTEVGEIRPSGAWNIDEKGNQTYLGIDKDDSAVEIEVRLKLGYDAESITIKVNDKTLPTKGISSYFQHRTEGEEYYTSNEYSYEIGSSEKSFSVSVGGIKDMTIGGHKWKLHGIKEGEDFYLYGNLYGSSSDGGNIIGKDMDYRFDFKTDGSLTFDAKDDGNSINDTGTWTEANGILTATLTSEAIDITLTLMTAAQREELITKKEIASGLAEAHKAVGIGILWEIGEVQIILVLDI